MTTSTQEESVHDATTHETYARAGWAAASTGGRVRRSSSST